MYVGNFLTAYTQTAKHKFRKRKISWLNLMIPNIRLLANNRKGLLYIMVCHTL